MKRMLSSPSLVSSMPGPRRRQSRLVSLTARQFRDLAAIIEAVSLRNVRQARALASVPRPRPLPARSKRRMVGLWCAAAAETACAGGPEHGGLLAVVLLCVALVMTGFGKDGAP